MMKQGLSRTVNGLLVLFSVLLFESFHTAFGIDYLLRTRKERVTTGTNINIDVAHR